MNSLDPANAIEITSSNLDEILGPNEMPLLLEFWATWCVPCMLMKRTVTKAAASLEGTARVGLVNIDESPDLVARFQVQSTPTMLLLRDGEVVARWSGMATAGTIKHQVVSAL